MCLSLCTTPTTAQFRRTDTLFRPDSRRCINGSPNSPGTAVVQSDVCQTSIYTPCGYIHLIYIYWYICCISIHKYISYWLSSLLFLGLHLGIFLKTRAQFLDYPAHMGPHTPSLEASITATLSRKWRPRHLPPVPSYN